MLFAPQLAAKAVQLNNRQLVGKTRLQKTVYFLEKLGAGFGFEFDYHYYGPYSEDLSTSIDGAESLDLISTSWKYTKSGTKFAIFQTENDIPDHELDSLRSDILATLSKYDSISLELAATADFLKKNGFADDPWTETINRKPEKASSKRVLESKKLLKELSHFDS